jgi:hypothetical protein
MNFPESIRVCSTPLHFNNTLFHRIRRAFESWVGPARDHQLGGVSDRCKGR